MTPNEGQLAGAISNAISHHYHARLGRGPVSARTVLSDGLVVVILERMLTEAESYLVRTGKAQAVDSARRALHSVLRTELVSVVEDATGERVIAVMGDQHLELDIAVHVFILDSGVASSEA